MLILTLSATDDQPEITLELEHSLVSLSKWEAEHKKPFFHQEDFTHEDTVSYIEKMMLHDPPEGDWASRLTPSDYAEVSEYINSSQTATWFRKDPSSPRPREINTTELIYYWMIQFGIPFQPCETWHFSRLSTLIEIAGRKQSKPKKMNPEALRAEMARINAERRAKLGTTG